MTLHAALSSEQELGSIVQYGRQQGAQCRAQWPVTPALSCPGLHGADVTPVPSATPLYRAGVWLMLREWLDALVECDALSGWSVKATSGLMSSRPRARRRIGTSPKAFRVGPRARGLGRGEELVARPRPSGVGLGRTRESAKALRREPRANQRIGRGLVVVSWLRYLQGLSNFFGSCLGYPFLWYPTVAPKPPRECEHSP